MGNHGLSMASDAFGNGAGSNYSVIARLDRAIQYHGRWLLDRPVNPRIKSGEGDDSGVGCHAQCDLGQP